MSFLQSHLLRRRRLKSHPNPYASGIAPRVAFVAIPRIGVHFQPLRAHARLDAPASSSSDQLTSFNTLATTPSPKGWFCSILCPSTTNTYTASHRRCRTSWCCFREVPSTWWSRGCRSRRWPFCYSHFTPLPSPSLLYIIQDFLVFSRHIHQLKEG